MSRSRSRERHPKRYDIHPKRRSYSYTNTNNAITKKPKKDYKNYNNYNNYYPESKYSSNNYYYQHHNHNHAHAHNHAHYHYHNHYHYHYPHHSARNKNKSKKPSSDTNDLEGTVNLRNISSIYNGRYSIDKKLGQGTFGSVIECIDNKRQIRVAMKIIRSVKRYLDASDIEVEILNKLDKFDIFRNSLVIRLYKSFRCNVNKTEHSCLIFEKCGLSLYDYIKKNKYLGFTYDIVGIIGYQLFHSISFCHTNKLIHTDLKLENILFVSSDYYYDKKLKLYLPCDGYEIRIIDFGGATFEYDHHSSIINTRQYRGPEVILKKKWSYSSDIWSIGCILYELYMGELLFATHSDGEHLNLIKKILNVNMNGINVPKIKNKKSLKYVNGSKRLKEMVKDEKLCDLIEKCLKVDPNERITAKDAKYHPFFMQFRSNSGKNSEFNEIYNMINNHK